MGPSGVARGWVLGISAVVIAASLVIGSRAEPQVVQVAGYPLDDSPQAAASFDGNSVIVLATVVDMASARWTNPDPHARIRFVYTPVHLQVDKSFRGDITEGSRIVVRGLGGQVDDVVYEFDDMPTAAAFTKGAQVLVFMGDARDTGDGQSARTPNMVYRITSAGDAISLDGDDRLPLTEFEAILSER